MTTGVGSSLFLDTNVLVYANAALAPLHHRALAAVQQYHASGVVLWISRQILREYLATVTRPQTFLAPLPAVTATERVRYFQQQFHIAEDGSGVTTRLLDLVEMIPIGGKQIHDANIVATMQSYGVGALLTNNVKDFARFAHLITIVPLV